MKMGLYEMFLVYMPVFVAIIAAILVIMFIVKSVKAIAKKNKDK